MRIKFNWSYVWSVLALLLAVQCTFLSMQNRKLVQVAKAFQAKSEDTTIAVGESLTTLSVQTQGGENRTLDLASGQGTALVFFSRDCGACQQSMNLWNPWMTSLPNEMAARVVAIEVDPESIASMPHLGGAVETVGTSLQSVREIIAALPTTVLVDGQGTVAGTWRGAASDLALEELDGRLRNLVAPAESNFAKLLAKSRD